MKFSRLLYVVLGLIPFAGFYFAIVSYDTFDSNSQPEFGKLPSRDELVERYYSDQNTLLVYGTGNPEFIDKYKAYAENYRSRRRRRKVTVRSDRETTIEDLSKASVILVGTSQSNRILSNLSQKLPIAFSDDGFYFNGRAYREKSDMFTLFYPNPENIQFPIIIVAGNSDENIIGLSRRNLMRGDYQIFRKGKCMVFGFFSQDEKTRWEFDKNNFKDFQSGMQIAGETEHYRFHSHNIKLNENEMKRISVGLEENYRNIDSFFGYNLKIPKIDYHIYASFEDKGLYMGDTRLSHHIPSQNEVHTVIEDFIRGDDFMKDAALIIRQKMGEPKIKSLETGLSTYFSHNWRSKGYEYWASRLYLSGNMPALKDIFDNDLFQRESNLVMEPLAGTFVGFLIEKWGNEKFMENYAGWIPLSDEIDPLETGWKKHMDRLSKKYKAQIEKDHTTVTKIAKFQKGFCYAHEGYQIYNGYLSKKSDDALEKLTSIGSNAVSITPFTSMRDPKKPAFLSFSRSAGSENDESVIHASQTAKRLGMNIMLKPHIWVRRSWPGDIEMQSENDWSLFFDYYYRWIRHYALMAEMYEIDMLCVGTELAKATVGHEDEWVRMVQRLRGLYSGKMTYAANWGEEFENVKFWKAYDFIGIDCYYPLSKEDNPTDKELKNGISKVINTIEAVHKRYRKPVIFTEIGFTSTQAPWKQPHERERFISVNLEDQVRCYEAVFESIKDMSWCKGIYWWKWPSQLENGGSKHNGFTPNRKPAEKVVSKWYQKL